MEILLEMLTDNGWTEGRTTQYRSYRISSAAFRLAELKTVSLLPYILFIGKTLMAVFGGL